MKTRIQLYTVPGQVFYNATRLMVLKGADAVVFVCDSQEAMLDANREGDPDQTPALDNRLHEYLVEKSGNRYIRAFFGQHVAAYYTMLFEHAAPKGQVVAQMAAQHRLILDALIAGNWVRAAEALATHIRAQAPVLTQLL